MQDRPDAIPTSPPRGRRHAVDVILPRFCGLEAGGASTTLDLNSAKDRLDVLVLANSAAFPIEVVRPSRTERCHQPAASRSAVDRVLSQSLDASRHGPEFDASILFYLGLISGAVRSFRWTGVDVDDLRQIAALGILEAAERFDPRERELFAPYASYYMWRACTEYVPEHLTTIRVPPRSYWKAQRLVATGPSLTDDASLEPRAATPRQAAPTEAPEAAVDVQPASATAVASPQGPHEGAPSAASPAPSDPTNPPSTSEEALGKAPQRHRPPIRRVRRSSLAAAKRALRTASLDAPEVHGWRFALSVPSEDPSALEGLISAELREDVPRAFAALSRTQRTILRARFGLAGSEKTLVRLGRERGCSRESIRQYAVAAIRQLQLSLWRWDDSRELGSRATGVRANARRPAGLGT